MKNFILCLLISLMSVFNSYADTVNDTLTALKLKEVTVTSLYRNNVQTGSMINTSTIKMMNHGQGADYVLSTLPNNAGVKFAAWKEDYPNLSNPSNSNKQVITIFRPYAGYVTIEVWDIDNNIRYFNSHNGNLYSNWKTVK